MPLHSYNPPRRPPSVLDHILVHPFELGLAAWGIMAGGVTIFTSFVSQPMTPALSHLPQWLSALIGALFILGGFALWIGLLDDSEDLMRGWRIERSGLIISAAAWGAYAVTTAYHTHVNVLFSRLAFFVVSMYTLRYWATVREERRVREVLHDSS